jgi:hypothetical protein
VFQLSIANPAQGKHTKLHRVFHCHLAASDRWRFNQLFTFHAFISRQGAKEAKFAKKLEHKEHKDENRKRKLNQEQKDFCIRSFGSKK